MSSYYGPNAVLGSGDSKVENDRIPNLQSLIEVESTHKNDYNITAVIEVSKKVFRSHE